MADLTTLLSKFLTDLYSGSIGGSSQWASLTLTKTALGTTSTAANTVVNTTAAAAGAQQISPGFDWVGQGWKTDATAASQEVRFRAEVLPVQGTSAPTGTWKLGVKINGGSITYPLTVSSAGVCTALAFTTSSSGVVGVGSAGAFAMAQNVMINTAPTIGSGFGTSPSVVASNGTAAFTINVGTGGTASNGVVTMPAAANGWIAHVENRTGTLGNYANQRTVQIAGTTTSITLENQTISTGAALAWTASDVLVVTAVAY